MNLTHIKNKLLAILKYDVINNIVWLFFDKVLRMCIYLLVLGKIAEYLKVENFGILNYSMSLTGLFIPLVSLGLDNITLKCLLEDKDSTSTILSTTFYAKLLSAIVSFCICCAIGASSFSISSVNFSSIVIISLSLFLCPFDIFDIYFQSQVKSKVPAILRLVVFILFSFVRLYCIHTHKGIIYFSLLIILETFCNFVLIGWRFSKYVNFNFMNLSFFSFSKGKEMLSMSWSLWLSALSITIYMKIDQLMLGNVSNIELGYYSAAVRLSEIWNVIPVIVCSTYYPVLINLKSEFRMKYEHKIQTIFDFMFWGSICICILSTVFCSNSIHFLYGDAFQKSVEIAKVHIWSSIFVFLGVISNYVLLLENKMRITFKTTFIGVISNVVLNLWLIPSYGGLGAAWATLVSYMLSVMSVIWFSKIHAKYFYSVLKLKFYKKYD